MIFRENFIFVRKFAMRRFLRFSNIAIVIYKRSYRHIIRGKPNVTKVEGGKSFVTNILSILRSNDFVRWLQPYLSQVKTNIFRNINLIKYFYLRNNNKKSHCENRFDNNNKY